MERRTFLNTAVTGIGALLIGLFGITIFAGSFEITDQRYRGQLLGPTEFIFIVENTGGSVGDAEVKMELYEDDVLLKSESKVVSVPSDGSREVTIEMEVPGDANKYDSSVGLNTPF